MRDTTKGSRKGAMIGGEVGKQTFGILAPTRRQRRTTVRASVTASCTAGITAKVSKTAMATATTVTRDAYSGVGSCLMEDANRGHALRSRRVLNSSSARSRTREFLEKPHPFQVGFNGSFRKYRKEIQDSTKCEDYSVEHF